MLEGRCARHNSVGLQLEVKQAAATRAYDGPYGHFGLGRRGRCRGVFVVAVLLAPISSSIYKDLEMHSGDAHVDI